MEKIGDSKRRFAVMISVMVLLIIMGVVMTVRMLTDYGALRKVELLQEKNVAMEELNR